MQEPDEEVEGAPFEAHWLRPWQRLEELIKSSPSGRDGRYAYGFRRGFLRISDYYRELYDHLGIILNPEYDWTWLEEIKFGSWHDGDWTPLFRSPRLLELNRLEFIDDDYHSVLLEPLLSCPYLTSLKHLRLVMVTMDEDGFARLSDCRSLAGIRSFDLTEMGLGSASARSLATSELWDQLRSCRVVGSRFGDDGLAELAQGRRRPLLQRLDLAIGDYSDQGLIALAQSDRFPGLRELAVGFRTILDYGGYFGGEGVQALLAAPAMAQVRVVVSIMSYDPVPGELGDLCAAYPDRLRIRYRNTRESPQFQTWTPGGSAPSGAES